MPGSDGGPSKEFQEDGITRMREIYLMEQSKVPAPRPDQQRKLNLAGPAERSDRYVTGLLGRMPNLLENLSANYQPPAGQFTIPLQQSGPSAPAAAAPSNPYEDFSPSEALAAARIAMADPRFAQLPPEQAARVHALVRTLEQPDEE